MAYFRATDELEKTIKQVYLFGFVGIFVKLYGVKPADVALSPIKDPRFDLAAICGLCVAYLCIRYLIRYFIEYLEHEVGLLDTAEEAARSVPDLGTLNTSVVSDPDLQGIIASFQRDKQRYSRMIGVSGMLVFGSDILAPVIFMIICCVELTRPTLHFLVDLFNRL